MYKYTVLTTYYNVNFSYLSILLIMKTIWRTINEDPYDLRKCWEVTEIKSTNEITFCSLNTNSH